MARLSPERLVYTSAYGARDPIKTAAGVTESFHWGVDYGPDVRNKTGVILCAVFAGTATHLHDQYGALGVRVTSYTDDLRNDMSRIYGMKIAAGTAISIDLWHLAKRAVGNNIKVGEGAAVGEMGSTGRSTGVHVHVELRIGKVRVDPKPFIDAQASKAVAPAPDDYDQEDDMALDEKQDAALTWLGDYDRRKKIDDLLYALPGIVALTKRVGTIDLAGFQTGDLWQRRAVIDRLGSAKQQPAPTTEVVDVDDLAAALADSLDDTLAEKVADVLSKRLAS